MCRAWAIALRGVLHSHPPVRRALLVLLLAGCALAACGPPRGAAPREEQAAARRYQAPPLTAVHLTDAFWRPRLERNRTVTIPHILAANEATGRVGNFDRAAGRAPGPYEGRRFNDTDLYKVIEAASYALAGRDDLRLLRADSMES
jgi:Beta-L-arabinofuranosidase, GH127 catalytic domain